ncbi:MAG: exodeoxyribonuclease VII small subunit [Planctomycetes bacterium]|nr:exodeoxyribonuclease VII small subunit [Planctomycetota bacterium]
MAETKAAAAEIPFEQALAELETIVGQLETGDTGLEASLAAYERGVKLLRQCHGILQRAERKIELLSNVDAAGQPTTEPFDDTATFNEESAAGTRASTRSQKRSAAKPAGGKTARSRDDLGGEVVDDAPKLF